MNLTKTIAKAVVIVSCCRTATAQLLDDFSAPVLDETNWLKIDLNEGRPWGPGNYDTSSGALNMRTTGAVPVPSPFELATSGYMAVAWQPSLANPLAYANGSVRVRFRMESDVAPSIEMRGDLETFTAYDFNAAPVSGTFNINLFSNGEGTRLATIPDLTFSTGEDWWMEASTIGDQISMKVWQVGLPEPSAPQLSIQDTTLTQGGIALGAGLGVDNFEPVLQDATFDDISFFASEPSSAPSFSEVVVFGTSLTDGGNFQDASTLILGHRAPASPPYYMGRSSNGPNWVDVLSDELRLPRPEASRRGGMNYAFASATTGSVGNRLRPLGLPDMDLQVADYLANHTPSGDELFVVAGTAAINDAVFGQEDPAAPVAVLGDLVTQLAEAGARHVIMANGIVNPRTSRPDFVSQFNELLPNEMEARRLANTELNLYEFDAQQTVDDILADPQSFGVTNTTDPACRDCENGRAKNPSDIATNPNEFFFWDEAHFTGTVNQAIGLAAFRSISLEVVGDLDGSGNLNPGDIDLLTEAIRSNPDPELDFNGDGTVDVGDLDFFVNELAMTYAGDTNLDGSTNFSDFLTLSSNFGMEGGWGNGNFGTDPLVDFEDFLTLSANFGRTVPGAEVAAVPEPRCDLALLAFAATLFNFRRGRLYDSSRTRKSIFGIR